MAQDRLDLHVVLNEDSIDLREETFEKFSVKNRPPHRTTSHQVLSHSQNSDIREKEPLRVNGLKRLANNLYFTQQQKNKANLRNKCRNRATSADPRFRRERSPAYSKDASQTQSDSQVAESSMQHEKKKTKTQSDSKFIIDRLSQVKKSLIPKPSGPYSADQSEPVNCKINVVVPEVKEISISENCPPKDIVEKMSSAKSTKYSNLSHQIYSCETLTPSNIEHSTMTDEIRGNSTLLDCKSLYQSAVTDVNIIPKNAEVKVYNTTEIYLDDKEPLKPYWDDPRLIEKYSKLLKPVQIRKSKSSWTLPLAAATPPPPHPVCSKCVCANIPQEIDCTYEIYEDPAINYDKIKMRIYNAMRSNYYLAAFFVMGSLCGLMLVTLVIWVLANDIIWAYVHKRDAPKLTGVQWLTAYIGGGILHGMNVIVNRFYQMIVMPRKDAFDTLKEEERGWSIF